MKTSKFAIFSLALSMSFGLLPNLNAHAFVPASEMRDLSSNHWAYKAIEALVEKYGVMSGFPDKTFKGAKNLTRYEMAAALFKVMTKVEELIAKANKAGTADTNNNQGGPAVSKEDLETLTLLQKEFRTELDDLKGRVDTLAAKVDKFGQVKVGGKVEVRYRDRVAVTDSTKAGSPLNGLDIDGDLGRTKFNEPGKNLITEFERTPFRVKTSLDISASLVPGVRFYGTFIAGDGTIFKLGNTIGQVVSGHFGDEGLLGNVLYTQRSIISLRANFENEDQKNSEKENIEMKPLSTAGTEFYHENKPGVGLNVGFMNFQNIARTGTKLRNHFGSEKWIGHGYGLVGFGADEVMVKDNEVKNDKGETEKLRNSVSRFWASGINVSRVDPDSERYNNVSSPAIAVDATIGPLTLTVAGNAGSPYTNRLAALNNIGGGGVPLTGLDFINDKEGGLINEKVIVGTKDLLIGRTTYNLLNLPSEYGDGYGLVGLDLDLGWLRAGINANDYWLDSTFSLSGTRKSVSGVIDIGTNRMGITLQTNYHAIGLDTYSAGVFLNDLGGIDLGFGLKAASRGIFNIGQITGTNVGGYAVLPQFNSFFPKLMFAFRQSFGDNFGSPKDFFTGADLPKVSMLKDSGLTLGASMDSMGGSNFDVGIEYNALMEGALWGFNFMAHDLGVFTSYRF